jgi:hypothetical protein
MPAAAGAVRCACTCAVLHACGGSGTRATGSALGGGACITGARAAGAACCRRASTAASRWLRSACCAQGAATAAVVAALVAGTAAGADVAGAFRRHRRASAGVGAALVAGTAAGADVADALRRRRRPAGVGAAAVAGTPVPAEAVRCVRHPVCGRGNRLRCRPHRRRRHCRRCCGPCRRCCRHARSARKVRRAHHGVRRAGASRPDSSTCSRLRHVPQRRRLRAHLHACRYDARAAALLQARAHTKVYVAKGATRWPRLPQRACSCCRPAAPHACVLRRRALLHLWPCRNVTAPTTALRGPACRL